MALQAETGAEAIPAVGVPVQALLETKLRRVCGFVSCVVVVTTFA